jgi:hypothetical protein
MTIVFQAGKQLFSTTKNHQVFRGKVSTKSEQLPEQLVNISLWKSGIFFRWVAGE